MKFGIFKNQFGGWSVISSNGETCGNFATPQEAKNLIKNNGYEFCEKILSEISIKLPLSVLEFYQNASGAKGAAKYIQELLTKAAKA